MTYKIYLWGLETNRCCFCQAFAICLKLELSTPPSLLLYVCCCFALFSVLHKLLEVFISFFPWVQQAFLEHSEWWREVELVKQSLPVVDAACGRNLSLYGLQGGGYTWLSQARIASGGRDRLINLWVQGSLGIHRDPGQPGLHRVPPPPNKRAGYSFQAGKWVFNFSYMLS